MVHVFIVNETTLKYHLEYMFAGTGAKDKKSPFLQNSTISYNASTERHLVGMIADVSRIRPGDKIVFYLQASTMSEGKFFGFFNVDSLAFFDENDENNYLGTELGKGLSYRIHISPDRVYAKGATEHDYLDSLHGIDKVTDMCWSLIYRKLKGNRGCTMITNKEYNRLKDILEAKNNHQILQNTGGFTYNSNSKQIEATMTTHVYSGRQDSIDIKNRLITKFNSNRAFESHLQAYILQNIDKEPLKRMLLQDNLSTWIGNEVSCGVGMQRIDIMTVQETDETAYLNVIELKCGEAYDDIINRQLPWYIKWLNDYIVDTFDKHVIIQPVVLTYETEGVIAGANITGIELKQNTELMPVKNIFFSINNNEIVFRELTGEN